MTDEEIVEEEWVADDSDVLVDDDSDGPWEDPDDRRAISPVLIAVAIVAVLGVLAILLVSQRNDGKKSTTKRPARSEQRSEGDGRGTPDGPTVTSPPTPQWPNDVLYRPAVFGKTGEPVKEKTDAKAGVYIWSDFDGWYVFVVDPSGKAAARGTLVSSDEVATSDLVVQGAGSADAEGRRINFDFSTVSGPSAGMVFNPGFYASTILVDLDGDDLPVFLGQNQVPAPSKSVTITKA